VNKNKGFTLIELLAVIVIIGLVAIIAIPAISKTVKNSKNNTIDIQENLFLEAGTNYFLDKIANDSLKFNLYEEKSVTLDTLIDLGYIKPIKDPGTGNNCDGSSVVKAVFAGGRKYEYAAYFTCGKYTTIQDNRHFKMLKYQFLNGAQKYIVANPSSLPSGTGSRSTLTYTTLKTGGYISTLNDVSSGNECSTRSVVVIENTGNNTYKYLSGLICENYINIEAWDLLKGTGYIENDSDNNEIADNWQIGTGISKTDFNPGNQKVTNSAQNGYLRTTTTFSLSANDRIYYRFTGKGNSTYNYAQLNTGSTAFAYTILSAQTEKIHNISTCTTGGTYFFAVNDTRTSGFTPYEINKVIVLNLTTTFGAGNEPLETKIESLMNNSGY
jgi:type IV pilus assembly protein PilA